MKIYTKVGDGGNTSLYDGSKVGKDHIVIDCVGTIDELNSEIGCIIALNNKAGIDAYASVLTDIQSQLFDFGSVIAFSNKEGKNASEFDVEQKFTKVLEESIDKMTAELPKLKNFILPGGSVEMATIHRARTICRRTERTLVSMRNNVDCCHVQHSCLIFMNRLSDFLFTLARYVGHVQNVPEVIYRKVR